MDRSTNYFEFGSGGSTERAVSRQNIRKIHVVENDMKWVSTLRARPDISAAENAGRLRFSALDFGPVGLNAYPLAKSPLAMRKWPAYSEQIKLFAATPWDLVLVDGRFRVACALKTLQTITNPVRTKVLIHDYERLGYHVVENFSTPIQREGRLVVLQKKAHVDK